MNVLNKANELEVPKSGGLTAGGLVKEVVQQVEDDRVKAYAGNLAYRGLFALFAILILAFSVLGVFGKKDLVERAIEQSSTFLPDPVKSTLEKQIIDPAKQSSSGAAPALRAFLAILGAIYGLSALARGVIDGMNAMYRVHEQRPFWRRQALSVVMAGVVLIMLLGAFVLVAVGPSLDPAIRVARWPLLLLLVLVAYAMVYYFAPSVQERWRFISHGSVVAVPLWTVFSLAFSFYVERYGEFGETYGPLAGVIVLLLYMFISSLILLVGAEVNHVVARHQGRGQPEAST